MTNRLTQLLFWNTKEQDQLLTTFLLVTFFSGIVNLVFILMNAFSDENESAFIFTIFGTIGFFTLYIHARLNGEYRFLVWPYLVFAHLYMAMLWLANDGSQGTMPFAYVFLAFVASFMLPKRHYIPYFVLTFITLITLLYIEVMHPEWVTNYATEMDRRLDVSVMLFLCVACTLILSRFQRKMHSDT